VDESDEGDDHQSFKDYSNEDLKNLSRRRQKKSFDLASGKKIPREVYSFGNTV
jgi:hypothetical protein